MGRAERKLVFGVAAGLLSVAAIAWLAAPGLGMSRPIGVMVALAVTMTAAWATPTILGGISGVAAGWKEASDGAPAEPEAVQRLAQLSINEVRQRADLFFAQYEHERHRRSQQRGNYYFAARRWRRLERLLHKRNLGHVGALGAEETERWAALLGMAREDRQLDPHRRQGAEAVGVVSAGPPMKAALPDDVEVSTPPLMPRTRHRPPR